MEIGFRVIDVPGHGYCCLRRKPRRFRFESKYYYQYALPNFVVSIVASTLYHVIFGPLDRLSLLTGGFDKVDDEDCDKARDLPVLSDLLTFIASIVANLVVSSARYLVLRLWKELRSY